MPSFNDMRALYRLLEVLQDAPGFDLDERRTVIDAARQYGLQGLYDFLKLYPKRYRQFILGYQRWRERASRVARVEPGGGLHNTTLLQRGYGILDRPK